MRGALTYKNPWTAGIEIDGQKEVVRKQPVCAPGRAEPGGRGQCSTRTYRTLSGRAEREKDGEKSLKKNQENDRALTTLATEKVKP